jgi:putative NIF3 family GTP cyclohydrolase 1 type 2
MKVIVVRAHDKQIKGANPFVVGVFSSHEKADSEIEYLGERYANAYHFSRTECEVDKREVGQSEPEVSLEERVEALEQYMNVAQMKIMRLQNAVQSLTFNVRGQLGDERTRSIMEDVMKGFGRHK